MLACMLGYECMKLRGSKALQNVCLVTFSKGSLILNSTIHLSCFHDLVEWKDLFVVVVFRTVCRKVKMTFCYGK